MRKAKENKMHNDGEGEDAAVAITILIAAADDDDDDDDGAALSDRPKLGRYDGNDEARTRVPL